MNYESYRVVEKSPCGRYIRYNHMLGDGASKQVYIGWDRVEKLELAWNKIVFRGEDEKLFADEATLLKSLNHEKVIKCFCYWFDDESKTMNMITELFPSGSLKKYMDDRVDLGSIRSWGRQILEGLNFLHSQSPKIIHRDIKCDNVFIDDDGKQVKLGDFGLAARVSEGDFAKEAKGTPEFMAPECYDGKYNELVDVYSFGMCLLEMITGEYPYMECETQVQIFKKVYTGVKPACLGKVNDLRLKEIIEKCMLPASVRPSAEELLKDPFFLYSDGSSTMEACADLAISSGTRHSFKGLRCCTRVVAWTLKKYQRMRVKFSKSKIMQYQK